MIIDSPIELSKLLQAVFEWFSLLGTKGSSEGFDCISNGFERVVLEWSYLN